MDANYILAVNPGATSTKIAAYHADRFVFLTVIRHDCDDLMRFRRIVDQLDYRKELVLKEVRKNQIPFERVGMIISRGGLVRPIKSGVYEVNKDMIRDLREGVTGEHASNLGGLIGAELIREFPRAKAYICDPVVVDELQDVARLSGHPAFRRISIFHALNQKATARTHARSRGEKYEDLNLIVAHLGSGISVGAHRRGRVIDVNNALNGEGPFAPERSGTLPTGALVRFCFEEAESLQQVNEMIAGKGGLYAYLGHKDAAEMEKAAREGKRKEKLLQDAMAYQISKEIGAMAAVLKGDVDATLITGGIAYNEDLTACVRKQVDFIAPVFIYPGEDEMQALVMNGSLVLEGSVPAREYSEENMVKGIDLERLG